MKKLLLLFSFITVAHSLYSQSCANYSVTRTTGITYTSIATTGNPIYSWRRTSGSLANQQDDNRSYQIPIGFDFWYLGTRYNYLSVSTNGFCDFSSSTSDGDVLPAAAGCGANQYRENPDAFTCNVNGTWLALAPLYDDIWVNNGGANPLSTSIRYLTTGAYPTRVFTLEWINMDAWNAANPPSYTAGASLNFQVKLYEGTGNIEFVYGLMNGGTATWAYACGINSGSQSVTATAAQLLNQTIANTPTFSNSPETTTLATVPNSSTSILFSSTPPTAASGALTFSNVTASGMTLSWPDWASGELGYVIYISDDGGVTYNFLTQLAANSTSYNAITLSSGTTYLWKVHAVSEGKLSSPLTGSQATLPKGPIKSVTSGNWSNLAVWDCTCVPTTNDDVTISDGTTVTIDMNASCNDLFVGEGVSGSLVLGNSVANRTVIVRGSVNVRVNGSFTCDNVNAASHQLWIKEDFVNNGTLNLNPGSGSIARSIFFRIGNQTISGSGGTTNFGDVVLKLDSISGTPYTLEVTSTKFSASSGFLDMRYGSFKFSASGANTITPFSTAASYNSYCGLWMNSPNSVMNSLAGVTFYGPLKVTGGVFNVGTAADHCLTSGGNIFTLSSGTINIAGRFDRTNGVNLTDFRMSGGLFTVNQVGSTSGALAPFTIDVVGSSFNWTGGDIVIQNAGSGNLGYLNTGASGSYTVGTSGSLQIGNGSTPAAQNIRITTNIPVPNLVVNNINSPVATLATSSLAVNNDVLLSPTSTLAASNLNISAGGNWTNNGGVYTPGTNVTIFNGSGTQAITGTVTSQTFNDITVLKPAAQVLQSGGSTNSWTLRNLLITSGVLTAPSSTMFVTGNWTNNGSFNSNSGAVSFSGSGGQSISSTANAVESYYWFYTNKSGGTLNTSGTINTINVSKTLRVINGTLTGPTTMNVTDTCGQQGGTFNYPGSLNITGNWVMTGGTANQSVSAVSVGGNWTQNAGTKNSNTCTVIFNGTGAQQINGSAGATQTFYNITVNKAPGTLLNTGGGTLTTLTLNNDFLQTQGDFSAPTAMNVAGNWTHNAGTFTPNTGLVTFNGSGSRSITSGALSSETFYNVTLNKSVGTTLDVTGTFTSITLNNNLTITQGNLSAPSAIFIAKDYSRANSVNAIFTHNNGRVVFNGAAAQALGAGAAQTFYNVEIRNTGGTISSSANPLSVNNFEQWTGNFTTANNSVFNISGNYRQESGTFSNAGTTTINLSGNFVNNGGTFTHNTGSMFLAGSTSSQTLRGQTTVFNNLVLNNTFATNPQIVLDTFITVRNALTLTSGIVQTSSINILTLDKNATGAITTAGIGSSACFVDGPLRYTMAWQNNNTTLNFPIGKNGVYGAASLVVRHTNNTSYAYTGEMIASSPVALNYTLASTTNSVSQYRYLDLKRGLTATPNLADSTNLQRTGGNSPVITMYYVAADGVSDPANLTICKTKKTNQIWYDLGATASGSPAGSVTSPGNNANFTAFSYFVLANKNGGTNILPVELISFEGKAEGNYNQLNWKSATEKNLARYELESSGENMDFHKLTSVDPLNSTSGYNLYDYQDRDFYKPLTYYRLKMIDRDNTFKYSPTIAIGNSLNVSEKISVYPNPASEEVFVSVNSDSYRNISIEVNDMLSRTLYSERFDVNPDQKLFRISTNSWISGCYLITIKQDNLILGNVKLIVNR